MKAEGISRTVNGNGPASPGQVAASPSGHANGDSVDEMNRQGRRIQELVGEIDALPDTPARALMQECMTSLLGFYGDGLERMLQVVKRAGVGGQKVYDDLIHDRVVSGLLLIHGLHPVDIETRLREAIEKIRPYMQSHGGNVEVLSLEGDYARLRLEGACKTCPSSAVTLELAVRHAIEEACPDLLGFDVEGVPEATEAPANRTAAEWVEVKEAQQMGEGALIRTTVLGVSLIVCKTMGNLYAYRDRCPACNLPLHLGTLEAGVIACRAGHRFSIQKAGTGVDDAQSHLDPVPLVARDGKVEVALAEEG